MYIDGNARRYLKWELTQNWMPIGQMADLFKTNISANEINLPRGQGTLSERECVSLFMAGKCFN